MVYDYGQLRETDRDLGEAWVALSRDRFGEEILNDITSLHRQVHSLITKAKNLREEQIDLKRDNENIHNTIVEQRKCLDLLRAENEELKAKLLLATVKGTLEQGIDIENVRDVLSLFLSVCLDADGHSSESRDSFRNAATSAYESLDRILAVKEEGEKCEAKESTCHKDLEVYYKNGRPQCIRDITGVLFFFSDIQHYNGQEERYKEEVMEQYALAEYLLVALKNRKPITIKEGE